MPEAVLPPPGPGHSSGPENGNSRRTLTQAGLNAGLALTRSIAEQPIMIGLLLVLLVITGAFFVIAREERKARHAEVAMILDRCVQQSR
jgi:hypothetical protein